MAEKYHALIRGGDNDHRPETFRLGPPVELHENRTADETYDEMVDSVRMCINSLAYEPENICLIATRNDILQKLKNRLKEELDLDFPVVLCYLNHRSHFLDAYETDTADKMNRNMVYTAITRSIEMLHVFMLQNCSDGPLGDLKKILKG